MKALTMTTLSLTSETRLPSLFPLMCALSSARRAWVRAGARQRQQALERRALAELQEMNARELADIGLHRGDLPWMGQRNEFARLLDDHAVYMRAYGVGGPELRRDRG